MFLWFEKVLGDSLCLDESNLFNELKGIIFMSLVPMFLLSKLGCCLPMVDGQTWLLFAGKL